jgi:2',3'-cyclic-nucleotide 2'-phosphodiesterase (5'-nucleotidase family)
MDLLNFPADCLVTVNGDFLGGSRLAELTKGKVIIDILNQMKIDAVVLGNHEVSSNPVVFS